MSFQYLKTTTDQLAYLHHAGDGAGYFFLNGRHMSLGQSHAVSSTLYEFFVGEDVTCTFFDYGGWGESVGHDGVAEPKFALARWLQNAADLLEATTPKRGAQVLVGYSLGVWLALALAQIRPKLVSGIVGISPSLLAYVKETKATAVPNFDGTPLLPVQLVNTPKPHVQLLNPQTLKVPVRLMHGMADTTSSYHTSLNLAEKITAPSLDVTLLAGCDHHYKRAADQDKLVSLFL